MIVDLSLVKRVLLLACLVAIGGYFWLENQQAKQTSAPVISEEKEMQRVRLDIKKSVRSLFEEWKNRKLTFKGKNTTSIVPERELAEIRKALFSEGIYSEQAFQDAVARALFELGVAQDEVSVIANELINLRSSETSEPNQSKSRKSLSSMF
jgi:hypothetical protein